MAHACPHLSRGKEGRWLTFACRSPGPCPGPGVPGQPPFPGAGSG